jgi:hypothetical protein
MKANKLGFGKTDLQNSNPELYPDISDAIQQTLARLLGFDIANSQYKSLVVDSDGRLLVSTSALATTNSTNSAVSVGVASTAVVAANANRKSIYLYNNGTLPIFVGYGLAATLALGFPIPVGGAIFEDKYLGSIFAISTLAAQDLRVLEIG